MEDREREIIEKEAVVTRMKKEWVNEREQWEGKRERDDKEGRERVRALEREVQEGRKEVQLAGER